MREECILDPRHTFDIALPKTVRVLVRLVVFVLDKEIYELIDTVRTPKVFRYLFECAYYFCASVNVYFFAQSF